MGHVVDAVVVIIIIKRLDDYPDFARSGRRLRFRF